MIKDILFEWFQLGLFLVSLYTLVWIRSLFPEKKEILSNVIPKWYDKYVWYAIAFLMLLKIFFGDAY